MWTFCPSDESKVKTGLMKFKKRTKVLNVTYKQTCVFSEIQLRHKTDLKSWTWVVLTLYLTGFALLPPGHAAAPPPVRTGSRSGGQPPAGSRWVRLLLLPLYVRDAPLRSAAGEIRMTRCPWRLSAAGLTRVASPGDASSLTFSLRFQLAPHAPPNKLS